MSDTASPSPEGGRKRRGCCGKLILLGLLALLALGGYGLWARSAALAERAYEFPPFQAQPFEASRLALKFKFLELPGQLLGTSTEVVLDEQELNVLLFAGAGQTEHDRARVRLVEDRVELLRSRWDAGQQAWINVRLLLALSMGPDAVTFEVIEGQVGDYELGPVTRPLLERLVRPDFERARADNARLKPLHAFFVRDRRAHLIYDARQEQD